MQQTEKIERLRKQLLRKRSLKLAAFAILTLRHAADMLYSRGEYESSDLLDDIRCKRMDKLKIYINQTEKTPEEFLYAAH